MKTINKSTSKTVITAIATVVAGATLALGAPSAMAATSVERVATQVNFADLDLDTTAGAKALYQRIDTASRNVCGVGDNLDKGSLKEQRQAKACYQQALKKALEAVGEDSLAQLPASQRREIERLIA